MAKDTSNNIKIHFRAEGEEELKNAIKQLSAATKQLKNSQVQLAKSIGMTDAQRKKAITSGNLALRNQRNMNAAVTQGSMSFSVFRSKLLLASFATGLFAMTVGKLVKAFAEQESSEKRIDAALASTGNISGLTGNQIRKMTKNLQEVGVVGDEVNNKVAALLLTFTNIRGQAFERTMVAANNMAISISGGIPSFEELKSTALQLGKALQDPAGQLGALSRSGFTFTGSQKEMIKQLVKQNKLMEAQSIILDAADTQYGKLSETVAQTAEGAFAKLGLVTGDLAEDMGEKLAPSAKEFAQNMTDLVISLQDNIDKMVILALTVKDTAVAYVAYRVAIKTAITLNAIWVAGLTTAIIRQAAVTMGLSIFAATAAMAHMRQQMLNEELDEGEDLWAGYGNKVSTASIDLSDAQSKIASSTLSLKLQQELRIASINLENSGILQLTESEIAHFESKKRDILITQELNKIDATKRQGMREEVERLVDLKLGYDKFITKMEDYVKLAKSQVKQDKLKEKIQQAIIENENQSIINTAKIIAARQKDKSEITRIDNLDKFNKKLMAVTGTSQDLQAFIDGGMGLQDMSDIMFQSNSELDKMIRLMIESVLTGNELDEAMKQLKDTFKEISNQKTPFDQFSEDAQLALSSVQGFSDAYSSLIDERMNRELEALKATRSFEEASQEEREVMENKIEQRYKSQRRKAFQIEKASNIAEAIMDVRAAYNQALIKGPGFAAFVAALGFAQVSAIAAQPAPRFATGGSFITSGAQNLMVGEQGAERVTIQPLGGISARQGANGSQTININVSAPLIDDTILDVIIPKIEEAGKLNLA